jgi:16S rRNA (guanine(966)-N(2))-methyltransferase RsmD
MRIVSGTARGRRLTAPRGLATRPTSDRVRSAIFNVLGQYFDGGAVLDLYAGTGALALEALSRGCERAVCVESERAAAEALRRNADACGFADRVEVRQERVEAALARLPRSAFARAFLDPPYAEWPGAALEALPPLLAPGARVVAEHGVRQEPAARYGRLVLVDRRTYGDTGISIYRLE